MTGQSVADYLGRVEGVLVAEGRGQIAQQLAKLASAPTRAKPVVHIAGEVKRGKSSLLNALLARPGLSPVAIDVATATPITFFYADPPQALCFRYGSPEGEVVDVEDAQRLATVDGNPGNGENVRALSIGIPAPLLASLTLVDTPGVGGLESGHGALTLQSLRNADALLFVMEAGAQLRAAELEFLRNASTRIDTVIFVLAKVDAFRGWRAILEDNLGILRQQAPRFATCPVVPVSSALALRGIESGDPDDAVELRAEAGVTELERVLSSATIGRSGVLRDMNLVRAGLSAINGVERANREKLAAAAGDGAGRRALEAEQARLRDLNETRARWPQVLDAGIRTLTLDRSEAVTRRTIEIRRKCEERLKEVSRKDHDTLPGELLADLTALASDLNEKASSGLMDLVTSLLSGMDRDTALEDKVTGVARSSATEELASLSMGQYRISHFEKLSLLNSFSSGRSLGSLASGSGLGLTASTLIAPPVGIAIGVGLGVIFAVQAFRGRDRQLFVTEFTGWMRDQIAQAQAMMNSTFQRATVEIAAGIRESIRDGLSAREKEINEALAAGRALLQTEDGRRQKARQEIDERLQEVTKLQGEGRALLKELSAPPAGAPAQAGAEMGTP